jgi:hypothetical protein
MAFSSTWFEVNASGNGSLAVIESLRTDCVDIEMAKIPTRTSLEFVLSAEFAS